jgi:hypothetical protein
MYKGENSYQCCEILFLEKPLCLVLTLLNLFGGYLGGFEQFFKFLLFKVLILTYFFTFKNLQVQFKK